MLNENFVNRVMNLIAKSFLQEGRNAYHGSQAKMDTEEKGRRNIRLVHKSQALHNNKYDTGKQVQKSTTTNTPTGIKPVQHQFRTPKARHYAAIRNMGRDNKRKRLGMRPLEKSQMESTQPKSKRLPS